MPKVKMDFIVSGGEVKPAPPVGPALGQEGLPVGRVVADINKATEEWKGLKVPITITADPAEREWEIEVGTPLTSALLLQEMESDEAGAEARDLTFDQVKKVAELKEDEIHARSFEGAVRCVLGTMKSMNMTCEGKDPKEFIEEHF